MAQMVAHLIGNEEVTGSIPVVSFCRGERYVLLFSCASLFYSFNSMTASGGAYSVLGIPCAGFQSVFAVFH